MCSVSLSRRAQLSGGQPISDLMSRALATPEIVSLAAGFVDPATLPVAATEEILRSLFTDATAARAALQYGTTPGYRPLRESILNRFLAADSWADSPRKPAVDQVVLTAGSNQLLHLAAECLLDPGDIVLSAAPTYFVFLATVKNLGARTVGVPTDEFGILPAGLDETLRRLETRGELGRVKTLYLVDYFDNPCGRTMPLDRRIAVLDVLRRWSDRVLLHVLEDAAYREVRYEGDDVPSLWSLADFDRVVYAGTFSKSFSPGLRVGWGFLPWHLVEPVCNLKGNIDFGSANFNQHLLARVLAEGILEPHVEQVRAGYRRKLAATLAALDASFPPDRGVRWDVPHGGLYVWLTLPEGLAAGPTGTLFDAAVREGVLYVPGEYCYPEEGEPVRTNTIRLCFGVPVEEAIERGVAALARAVDQVRSP